MMDLIKLHLIISFLKGKGVILVDSIDDGERVGLDTCINI